MSTPLILGSVPLGSSFMIVSIQGGKPYALNGAPYNGGIVYYWEADPDTIIGSTTLPVFSASGTLTQLNLFDAINGGGLSFRGDSTTIGNAAEPNPTKFNQFTEANWFTPDILLSMPEYTIFNPAGGTASVLTEVPVAPTGPTGPTGPPTPTILADNIIILPVVWYYNCVSNPPGETINTFQTSIANWLCAVDSTIDFCPNTGGIPLPFTRQAWTNIDDCQVGNLYTYCPVNDLCGNNMCNGPCSAIYYDCTPSNNNYVCEFDPDKFFKETNWWENPYFIIAIIGLVVVSLIIFVILIKLLS